MNDEFFMREALSLARSAECLGEVPVGAIVVREGRSSGAVSMHPSVKAIPRRMPRLRPCGMRPAISATTGFPAAVFM